MSDVLTTSRLRLEPFQPHHLTERYVGWLNNPDVVRFSEQRHRRHTLESVAAYVRSFEGLAHYLWAIVSTDGQLGHIGNISARIDSHNRVADVGILVGERRVWGHGYGGEAWNAVCAFLLRDAAMRKVTGGAAASNTAMLAIMRRAGMLEDGRRLRHLVIDGEEVDVIHMALFQADARQRDAG